MGSIKLIPLLCSICFMVSCSQVVHKDGVDFKSQKYELKTSSKRELFIPNGRMAMTDSFLVIASFQQPDICKLYALYDHLKEFNYGKIGNGPFEFIQPLLTYGSGNTFGLNEVNQQQLAIIEFDGNTSKPSFREIKRMKAPYQRKKGELIPFSYYFVKLDNSHFVSLLGAKNGSFFTLNDSTLSPICEFGESPISDELLVLSARNRLNGRIVACDGIMCYATISLPYLACYERRGDKMAKKWSFYYAEAGYGVRNGDLLFDKDKSVGPMLDVKMDARYIYVLYMDQLYSEYDAYDAEKSCSNKILVFNHEGGMAATLYLDCRIKEMAVCSENLKLYGIAQQPDMSLVTFDLPENLY